MSVRYQVRVMGQGKLEDREPTCIGARNWPARLPLHTHPQPHDAVPRLAQLFLCSPNYIHFVQVEYFSQRD